MSVVYSIVFTSPGPVLFQLGSFFFRWYSVLISIAVLLGLRLSSKLAQQRKIPYTIVLDLLPIMSLISICTARAYYVVFSWSNYKDNLLDIFAIWKGGIAIHGALIGGTIGVAIFSYFRKQSFLTLMDILIPSLAMGQGIGRWGNFFNSEAFGLPTKSILQVAIPYSHRQYFFIDKGFFHPTFFYESLWDFGICLLILILFNRSSQDKIRLPKGLVTYFYCISYGLGRFWIEGLRSDPLCLIGNPPFCEGGLRMAQLISYGMVLLGFIGLSKLYESNSGISKIN